MYGDVVVVLWVGECVEYVVGGVGFGIGGGVYYLVNVCVY